MKTLKRKNSEISIMENKLINIESVNSELKLIIEANDVKLLYLAPETLLLQRTLDLLSRIKIDCFTLMRLTVFRSGDMISGLNTAVFVR